MQGRVREPMSNSCLMWFAFAFYCLVLSRIQNPVYIVKTIVTCHAPRSGRWQPECSTVGNGVSARTVSVCLSAAAKLSNGASLNDLE